MLPTSWSVQFRATLERYDESLLREVAARLVRPRNHWPAGELIERCVAALDNAPIIDRRLKEVDPAARRLLAFIGHSRLPRWRLGNLLELLAAAGHAEGPRPVMTLLEAGLLYPELPDDLRRLKSFEQWLGKAAGTHFTVATHPLVAARAVGTDLGLRPQLPTVSDPQSPVQEADGLDGPLRLAAVWQQAAAAPLRRKQQGDFFKRDFERLRGDPLLQASVGLVELPDVGLLATELAKGLGILIEKEGEITAAALPDLPADSLPEAITVIWTALLQVDGWGPADGAQATPARGNPYPSAYLLALLVLSRLGEGAWTSAAVVEQWIASHHPFWAQAPSARREKHIGLTAFLLGPAYELCLVQAARGPDGEWLVRLAPLGRWLLGIGERPAPPPEYPQMLLVQPNLEVIAYRQGLTPALIARLSRFAAWRSVGAACTLQLEPATIYRALESGLGYAEIVQTLERHGTRVLPASVHESLRTWAGKRDRITVYPAAVIFEFGSANELNEALARGLPGVRLTDRLAAVADERAIDYRHFRLSGTRDYSQPPERCIEVAPDGVTLKVDASRSDLLLETELPRLAELLESGSSAGPRSYRLTPASLSAARASGIGVTELELWFRQRTGRPLPAAVRLLLTARDLPPPQLRRYLVLEVATEELADGLMQWPATRTLIDARLGPTALAIDETNLARLRGQLSVLGMPLDG